MSLRVVLEFDAADGYAFGPIGGLPRTRILINGVPAELTMSDYLPPYEAPMSLFPLRWHSPEERCIYRHRCV